jgi:hypothetical protein
VGNADPTLVTHRLIACLSIAHHYRQCHLFISTYLEGEYSSNPEIDGAIEVNSYVYLVEMKCGKDALD